MRLAGTLAPGYYLGTWKHGAGASIVILVHRDWVDERGRQWTTYERSSTPGQVITTDFWIYPAFYEFAPCTEEDWLCAILAH